jgi:hypothetical protein
MRIASPATYTPRVIIELLEFVPVLLLILFGITAVVISGFFLLQVVVTSLRGKPYHVFQKRAIAAIQAGNLGWMAIICGPFLAFFIALGTLPLLFREPDFTMRSFAITLLIMIGVGAVAGIIGGGAFWVCSAFLAPVRKAANCLQDKGVWDADLDGTP